ncbi:hypothetical protein OOU_Y34scaffold00790g9 [Pyricularia oryzae Y34]|uniref:Uncharacterized protein n=2 Tax=Pyricularia oryzae TaxID=318829 RepID=A0AA97NQ04_PYRO3|nr:hypothetical protein OOU_Y34scaffold00790g9 [Pyricularia oryzae Y34]
MPTARFEIDSSSPRLPPRSKHLKGTADKGFEGFQYTGDQRVWP